MTNITFSRNVMFLNVKCEHSDLVSLPVADPGFPRGGGANSPWGVPTYDFAKFSQKLHEIERIWTPREGVHPKFYYVDLPLPSIRY